MNPTSNWEFDVCRILYRVKKPEEDEMESKMREKGLVLFGRNVTAVNGD